MDPHWRGHFHQVLLGDPRHRRAIVVSVSTLLVIASVAFVLGATVPLSLPWPVVALGIALAAGWWGAGLVPTAASMWLIGIWWFVFPPLVGYVSGAWANPSRYTHPRMQGFAYTSAGAELLGGLEYGLKYGLLIALVGGLLAYGMGAIAKRLRATLVG